MHCGCRAGRNALQQLLNGAKLTRRRTLATTARDTHTTKRATATPYGQIRSYTSSGTDDVANAQAPDATPPTDAPPAKGKVIFSGIQPTGVPHLGNYLGALRSWKRLQDNAAPGTRLLFCIVDLHAITVPRPREELVRHRVEMLAALLAIGLDPARCTIFFQSDVPAHSELQWILSCTASTGYLSRMTQWKSKMKLRENATLGDSRAQEVLKHGLFSYPVLQAADVLVHRATHVPVGEDQAQHLEFARECVTNFNHTYKTDCLVAPETLIGPSKRIMSLTNPLKKMSKSDPSPNSRVLITDDPDTIRHKIRRALTDGNSTVTTYDPDGRPGVANLLGILAALDALAAPEGLGRFSGAKVARLKAAVADALCAEFAGPRARYLDLVARPAYLREVAEEGAARARESAAETMRLVRDAVGLV